MRLYEWIAEQRMSEIVRGKLVRKSYQFGVLQTEETTKKYWHGRDIKKYFNQSQEVNSKEKYFIKLRKINVI